MIEPKISILMSVFNAEEFISESIDSVINQSFSSWELIVVDDGSDDSSYKILVSYANKDKRIKIIRNINNKGLTYSLNLGIGRCVGKYIARLDADDVMFPERLSRQYKILEENPQIFLLGTGVLNIDEKGKIIAEKKRHLLSPQKIKKILPRKNCFYHPTIMFRNQNVKYREKFIYSQDYDFYLQLLSSNKGLANIREPLVKYRISSNAISWRNRSKQKLFEIKARKFYYEREAQGVDNYKEFDPEDIMSINVSRVSVPIVLEYEIRSKFQLGETKKVRELSRKYLKNNGCFNIVLLLYLLSFLNPKIIRRVRKMLGC